ncbi:MAG: hypothetical protein MJ230_01340 [bacterium]|nr:hypothetical protein [bacterium]
MKKILFTLLTFTLVSLTVYADNRQEALDFFNNYVKAANNYENSISTMYAPNAVIIRQVVKPDGTTANAYTDTATYLKQMRLSSAVAKVRKYKNAYRNITVLQLKDGYKISAERQPSGESYWLKTYQIIKKQPNGKWLITEEMMQTKVQQFLKYVK